jgi:hypothetical protein
LDELSQEELDLDSSLRPLYSAGVEVGELAFVEALNGKLAAGGLPGSVTLTLPVASGIDVSLDSGKLKCPFAAYLNDPEPEEKDCDGWVNISITDIYAGLVASLANPANQPEIVTNTGLGGAAEHAYRSGVISGAERGRARARWGMSAGETPICDAEAQRGPVSASKIKGVYFGAQLFAAKLNEVMDSVSFPFDGTYPELSEDLSLCSFSAGLADVAQGLAEAAIDELESDPESGPCEGYNAPDGKEESYAQAREVFLDGASKGLVAEYYIASIALFQKATCGLGP